ncbi:hypothetical protein [Nocardioides sp. MH1]|uniref:hypothetical protein n=1 Tax=Nocardioides sp. MH1 TaxID=3242490 RepID=UPI003521E996
MVRSRPIGVLAVLGLVAALGALAPTPRAVAAQAQTVQFTTTAPSGVDWYTSRNNLYDFQYIVRATASSGLPVSFSIAPASADVCTITQVFSNDSSFGSGAAIRFDGGGTCAVLADQAGNEDFLPAQRAIQSFKIERVETRMEHAQARRGLPGQRPARFSARLLTWQFISSFWGAMLPFSGQRVTFSVAGRPVCTGTTGSDGIATCQGTLLRSELTRLRFTATYAGTSDYQSVSGSAYFALG